MAQMFAVTPQTIRRDINQLAEQGLLRRYHGGAAYDSSIENTAYTMRADQMRDEKQRIAEAVASLVPDNASLFINIGTTTEAIARALLNHRNLKIITNNLHVAATLSAKEDFEVLVAGGTVRSDGGIVGQAAVDFIQQFRVDFRPGRHQRHRRGWQPARLRLPGSARIPGDHRQRAASVPGRRLEQVRAQRGGPPGPDLAGQPGHQRQPAARRHRPPDGTAQGSPGPGLRYFSCHGAVRRRECSFQKNHLPPLSMRHDPRRPLSRMRKRGGSRADGQTGSARTTLRN